MPRKCRNCGYRIIEYPIYKGQEEGIPFLKGETPQEKWKSLFTLETWKKEWNWYNVIVGDWTKALILLTLIFTAWAYTHDSAAIREFNENPCALVEKNYQPCQYAKQQGTQLNISSPFLNLNISNPNKYT